MTGIIHHILCRHVSIRVILYSAPAAFSHDSIAVIFVFIIIIVVVIISVEAMNVNFVLFVENDNT